ncbi:MAG TPA: PD-(D/E)XK nuclease family protein [Prolixibacteraceae bacterium]
MSQSHQCFLQKIAGSLYRLHGQSIADLTIVFPNRRAGLFFTEYLNRVITGPVFSPEIITIQELYSRISPLHTEEPLQLIFRLYKIYKDLSGSKDSFDEFYLWGEMLLHDFDQVDKYLVDAELLFTNITDLKEIDEHFNDWNDERKEEIRHFWKSLNSGDQKRDQKEFARLWQVLYPVYVKFKAELYSQNIAYEGMLFRAAVENGDSLSSAYLSERKFVVAGFNALNSCEKELFQSLKNRGNISFYWDFDQYYTDDPNQEAGLFMRENLRLFPQDDFPYDTDLLKSPKSIQILHTTSQIGQTQLAAGEIPHSIGSKIDFDETAVVLCDEELLLPLLSSLPEEIDKVNVTMGLPLKQTPLFSLINSLISLQKKNKSEGGTCLFHYKSVLDILNNQLIQSAHPIECKSIVEKIVRNNLLYISDTELGKTDLFQKIFVIRDSVSELPDYFLAILYELFIFWENNKAGSYAINYQEYIYQIYVSVNKLNNTLFNYGAKIMGSGDYLSRETFFKLLLQYLSALSITFEGEPLSGIQVMGILETRSLDFQNVILLSVNEGIMPKANASGSFIPYHLRRGVGLPTIEEQNAMYAYYFYRLLQRAETVTFIYNSGNSGLRTGEKSRFLYQLMLESPFKITETGHENSIDPVSVYPITVQKHGKVLEELNVMMDSGRKISPTALDQYLHCPLSYYFKYISHFQEDEEVSEEVDARMFGKLFHFVMEKLYQPFLNKIVDENTVNSIIADEETLRKRLNEAFNLLFFKLDPGTKNNSLSGRNILVFEVIRKMVVQTLRVDLKRTPFEIRGLEQKVDAILSVFGGRKAIRIGGIIDRIDYKSGVFEVIDYKTGTAEHVFNTVADLFDKEAKKRNKAAFQTLVYAYIWDQTHPGSDGIFPGIYGLKKIFKEETNRLINRENGGNEVDYLDIKDQFEPMLTSLVEEIFNPELPFSQTIVEENCKYCNFISLCGKQSAQS